MSKIIFHVDFDSYFVSAHRAINPQYMNKPLAVARNNRRSIMASISYELKNKGVKVGQPRYMALEVEPATIFVKPNFDLYITLSNKIFDFIAENFCSNIEVYSIDECWIDMSDKLKNIDPVQYALKMQNMIKKHFKIPISIGIGNTKFIAKMSTSLAKPFGVKMTTMNDIPNNIWPLKIDDYFGIGKANSIKLKNIGIETIGQLAQKKDNDALLLGIFKSRTSEIINDANGVGRDILNYKHNDLKSIGHELTFLDYDLDDLGELQTILTTLAKKVAFKAQNRAVVAQNIYVTIRDTNRTWKSFQTRLKKATNDTEIIVKTALKIFNAHYNNELIRGVGVRLTNFKSEFDLNEHHNLFETEEKNSSKKDHIQHIIKSANFKFRKNLLKNGEQFAKEEVKHNIQSRFLEEDIKMKG